MRKPRVARRPNPADWRADEPLMLTEAVELFWPHGPLTVASLRTEIRKGRLRASRVAGRLFVTPNDIQRMFTTETEGANPKASLPRQARATPAPASRNASDDGIGKLAADAAVGKLRRAKRSGRGGR